jgi:hypothetical protein
MVGLFEAGSYGLLIIFRLLKISILRQLTSNDKLSIKRTTAESISTVLLITKGSLSVDECRLNN